MVGRILLTFLQLILIAFLAFLCREAWLGYEQEKLNVLYTKEGQPVQVSITNLTTEKKTWKDYITNSKYVGFSYKNKAYNTRYVQDSGWVGEGTKVWLLYHPGLDLFRQPGSLYHRPPNQNVSKLVHWTIISLFSYQNSLLFATVILGVLVAVLLFSLSFKITGWRFFRFLSSWLINLCFLGMGIFFTWDTWANYQYYQQLKTGGTASALIMLHKYKVAFRQRSRSNIPTYYYTADVRYQNREREIMISSDDYYRLSPGDQLTVIYNAEMDDMMSKDYSLGYWRIIFIIVFWVVIAYVIKKTVN